MTDRKNIPFIVIIAVSIVALIGVFMFTKFSTSGYEGRLQAQATEITRLKNAIEVQNAAITAGVGSVVQQTTGIDLERKVRDDGTAINFLQKITTWSNYEDYNSMRSGVMQDYNLNPDSDFMTVFLPAYGSTTDQEGNTYNVIDQDKLTCQYRDMKSLVTDINGGVYTYFTIVTAAGGKDGAVADLNFAAMYSVDGNGNLSNFNAYTLG